MIYPPEPGKVLNEDEQTLTDIAQCFYETLESCGYPVATVEETGRGKLKTVTMKDGTVYQGRDYTNLLYEIIRAIRY
jgi:hypothetical protein